MLASVSRYRIRIRLFSNVPHHLTRPDSTGPAEDYTSTGLKFLPTTGQAM